MTIKTEWMDDDTLVKAAADTLYDVLSQRAETFVSIDAARAALVLWGVSEDNPDMPGLAADVQAAVRNEICDAVDVPRSQFAGNTANPSRGICSDIWAAADAAGDSLFGHFAANPSIKPTPLDIEVEMHEMGWPLDDDTAAAAEYACDGLIKRLNWPTPAEAEDMARYYGEDAA